MKALLSVYDKTGLGAFAKGLAELGFELVSSGGTATFLEDNDLSVTRVEDLTGFPEMLGGRVKTLHPRIHAGILARLDLPEDAAALEEQGIAPFDLVCVNLYPFEAGVARQGTTEADAVELIDVGGPSMLRAAAKNFAHVAAVCRPADYEPVLAELRRGKLTLQTRRDLATRAFQTTAAYDAAISTWFADGGADRFPATTVLAFDKQLDLAYGENPHQAGAYYAERGVRSHLLARVEQVQGRDLSFNNLNDLNAARLLLREFAVPACVIVKHANPCGVALAETVEDAYERALAADPLSAYGGVVVLNRPVSARLGERLAEQFVEVLFAPGFDAVAVEALVRKPNVRVLNDTERRHAVGPELDLKRVLGGVLVQERDREVDDRAGMDVVCGELDEAAWGDALFAWRVVKHVTSNAIVLARGLQTLGIGAGQMSRVDAVRIAVEKAREHGHSLEGAVLASDAFFPFADGPQLALNAGVTAIVQPGGSKRDDEVVAAVEEAGAAMVFTGRRHFRH